MDSLTNKHLVIIGLGRQGIALARFAASVGATVTVTDLRSAEQLADGMAALEDISITYVLGHHPHSLLDEADVVALSGGVPTDSEFVLQAKKRGLPLTNDSLEFVRRLPLKTMGITGSAGKTTTTALVGDMCRATGEAAWVGGNIGHPLIEHLGSIESTDFVIQELSSFQLELWDRSPEVAALLNLTPNHLDRHQTMEKYAEAKANILRFQSATDIAVLGADDEGAMSLSKLVNGRERLFSLEQPVFDGAYLSQGSLWVRDSARQVRVCSLDDIQLPGWHNVRNVLAAITLADSIGIPVDTMRTVIQVFRGVPHRLELVDTVYGVTYVNDSIATAPERTLAALASFDEPVILLAGGRDKEMVWEAWAETTSQRVKAVVLFGELQETLEEALSRAKASLNGRSSTPDVYRSQTLQEAVRTAASLAQRGDIVLLSPGGTSFDAFQDFDARGRAFRQYVEEIAEG